MRRSSLLRSTPLRLAVLLTALFMAAFVASSLVAVQAVRGRLLDRLDEDIGETFAVLAASLGDNDVEDLVAEVKTHIAITNPDDQVFLLTAPTGERLAGNVPATMLPAGWSSLQGSTLKLEGKARYRVFAGPVGAYRLAVGRSYADTEEVGETVSTTFLWAILLVLASSILGGAVLASRLQRRIDVIAGTMAKVSEGDLGSRIPMRLAGDDIDILSGQINATLDRLSGLFDAMKQVSADIAHDLKTPLSRLKMTVQSALAKAEAGLSVSTELADADAATDQINATFDALLRIAQIEAGARKARFEKVALQDVVQAIVEAYADVVTDNGQVLLHEALMPAAFISGDRQLLLQLCSNLVENAMTHSPAGATVAIRLDRNATTAVLTVADDGPGIPAAERQTVLRRLYRLEKSRTTPGSGLGLSLVKAIADLHGANLTLSDNLPGLRVTVAFPAL